MSKTFNEYIVNPVTGMKPSSPYEMDTLVFPLVADTSPVDNLPFAFADCYNIIYVADGNPKGLKITLQDITGVLPDKPLKYGGITGTVTTLSKDSYYLSPASGFTPFEIRNQIQSGNDVLGNMPGAIWVTGQAISNSEVGDYSYGDVVTTPNSPLYGKPRFQLKIENAEFYLTTSAIGSFLRSIQWAISDSNLPVVDKLAKYTNEGYGNFYNERDYSSYPKLRSGKPINSIDVLTNLEAVTQPIADSLVRRTSDGFIAPGNCGYRIPITISKDKWSYVSQDGVYRCTITLSNTYITTKFNQLSGERDNTQTSNILKDDSIVVFFISNSNSFEMSNQVKLNQQVLINKNTLTFTAVSKPSSDISLIAILF